MSDMHHFNRKIIAEFRANDGKCGDMFEGSASKGGAPTNTDWYRNVVVNPDVMVEVGAESIAVHARLLTGDERDAVFDRHKERYPNFAKYEAATTRVIPVVALDPAGTSLE